jgi:hypothetical protein
MSFPSSALRPLVVKYELVLQGQFLGNKVVLYVNAVNSYVSISQK